MKKKHIVVFIAGMITGAVIASSLPLANIASAALPLYRSDREKGKFTTDSNGNVGIRVKLSTAS